jgi:hypothetical protein
VLRILQNAAVTVFAVLNLQVLLTQINYNSIFLNKVVHIGVILYNNALSTFA